MFTILLSRLSILNNTFSPSSLWFRLVTRNEMARFSPRFSDREHTPLSLLIPFHKFSRLLRARGGTMRRVEHARAENGKRPITRRRTIGEGNDPAVSRNYGILVIAPFPFLSFFFLFLSSKPEWRKRVWEIRRRRGERGFEKVFLSF